MPNYKLRQYLPGLSPILSKRRLQDYYEYLGSLVKNEGTVRDLFLAN